jgi:hypothetical protein
MQLRFSYRPNCQIVLTWKTEETILSRAVSLIMCWRNKKTVLEIQDGDWRERRDSDPRSRP